MSDPTIRPAAPADLAPVLALLAESGLITSGVADHFIGFLIAEDEGQVVGAAGVELYGDAALLRSVAVAPSRRNQGLGARLVSGSLVAARERGAQTIALLTEDAGGFFRRFGFRASARERLDRRLLSSGQFTDPSCATALIMSLDLTEEGAQS